nr:TetR/AcrR family transcriptional regulator [Kibdelosporangium sp. MJ126-NF4]CEL16363.1 Transcriptional regulator, TetR family [Kibdelosporangium sp. MJ126-NF4]CTQ94287.1 Transcriptional regulator, TetR family [Kibdelosporangium sp. MJ126-NF4]
MTRRNAKYDAIVRASRAVFGRVGYLTASIDVIAADAGVSTRTIYNHFDNKEHLFAEVLLASSRQVAEVHEAIIERNLADVTDITDVEAALRGLAMEWDQPQPEFDDHFAITRRMDAEREHFPAEIYRGWREAGPWRVQRALAVRFEQLRDKGLLDFPDAQFAAHHFSVLLWATARTRGRDKDGPLAAKDFERIAADVVPAFLYGCAARRSGG